MPDYLGKMKTAEIEICERCFGSGMEVVKGQGARPCTLCRKDKRRNELINSIPDKIKKYGIPELKSFAPRNNLHPNREIARFIFGKQVEIIAKAKANPLSNFYLAGKNGCGKTTIGYTILLNAFDAGRKVVATTLSELLREFQAYEMSSGEDRLRNRPCILPEQLRRSQNKYSILIDEVGSPKVSEYRGEMLFSLLNQLQNFGHQLIVTSNKNYRDFVKKWSQEDDTHGESISRRMSENALGFDCFWD